MSLYQSIGMASAGVVDRMVATLVSGLKAEFGRDAGEALARRFLEADETDSRWDARVAERWIGAYKGADDEEDFEPQRSAICGWLEGKWFCAIMLVDGDGQAHTMMRFRVFRSLAGARDALLHAH